MQGWADFGVWRDRQEGLWREVAEARLAKEARRGVDGDGGVSAVRWGTADDDFAVAELLELNGMPRWVAFEERFIVAEGEEGRVLAALRYRTESKRLILGLPVVDPWAGERRMVRALYGGAVELARELGVGEVVAHPTGPSKEVQDEYLDEAGWRRGFLSGESRMPAQRELPPGGWRRMAALLGVVAVPFSRAFRR